MLPKLEIPFLPFKMQQHYGALPVLPTETPLHLAIERIGLNLAFTPGIQGRMDFKLYPFKVIDSIGVAYKDLIHKIAAGDVRPHDFIVKDRNGIYSFVRGFPCSVSDYGFESNEIEIGYAIDFFQPIDTENPIASSIDPKYILIHRPMVRTSSTEETHTNSDKEMKALT